MKFSRLKNYIFSQKKVFLIFRVELCSPKIKKLLHFFKIAFLIFWKIELFEKALTFLKETFQARKITKTYSEKVYFILGNRFLLLQG